MRIITDLTPDADNQEIIYNSQDTMNTMALKEKFDGGLLPDWALYTARYSEKMLGPIMMMMRRGMLVDIKKRDEVVAGLRERVAKLESFYDQLCESLFDTTFNINSPAQLKLLFYSFLGIPEQTKAKKGEVKVATDREVLERIAKDYTRGRLFATIILKLRDLERQITFLSYGLSASNRLHYSYNIAGTETFRLSSSDHPLRIGGNSQNLPPIARAILIADPGYILCQADQQGAEARLVAYLSGDENYIKAVESGDSHTMVASMVFGFEPKRELAERKYYRDYSYRDMAKKGGHGCLTEDHEVLTPNGWVAISTKPSIIAGWQTDGSSCWKQVQHWTTVQDSNYVHIKGPSINTCVTPCHRFILNADGKWVIRRADSLKQSDKLPYTGKWYGGTQTVSVARLVAAYQGDGNLSRKGLIRFKFRRLRKIQRMRSLLSWWPNQWREVQRGLDTCFLLRKPLSQLISVWGKCAGPQMLTWSYPSLQDYVEDSLYWDGVYNHPTKRRATSSMNLTHCYWLQTLFQLTGHGSKVIDNTGKSSTNFSGKRAHWVSANARQYASLNCCTIDKGTWPNHQETFYCPTVEGEAFWVRRHGHMFVSLNSNYYGKPFALATQMKVEVAEAERFQALYFKRFPGISEWHVATARQLQQKGSITTPFGIQRQFWGRKWDDETLREAIAFVPQSAVGILTNVGLYRLWEAYEGKPGAPLQILMNGHDAAIFQIREDLLDDLLPKVVDLLTFPLPVTDIKGITRQAVVPWDVAIGKNWGKHSDKNPGGLKNWTPPAKVTTND